MQAFDHVDRAEVVEARDDRTGTIRKAREPRAGDEAVELSVALLENRVDGGFSTIGLREIRHDVAGVDIDSDRAVALALKLL